MFLRTEDGGVSSYGQGAPCDFLHESPCTKVIGWRYVQGSRGRTGIPCGVRTEFLYGRGVKTTLDINDQLLAEAKGLAAKQRTSLTRLIEEGLRLRLRTQAALRRGKPQLPVFQGRGGLTAGVDPLSNRAMLAALDDDASFLHPIARAGGVS